MREDILQGPGPYIEPSDEIKATFDVDDTVLEANPDFHPDYTQAGVRYVLLGGMAEALNPEFVQTGDTLVNLREAFGSRDPNTGEPLGRLWDRQCKLTGKLTFEEHLRRQFEDVLGRISVEQAIEFACRVMRPKKNVIPFLQGLHERGIVPIFVTNGADAIALPVLMHFFGNTIANIRCYANVLQDGKFRGLHGKCGVAKGELVLRLHNVRFFFGDSHGGDGPGAQAVWEAGGHVFALGHDGPGSLHAYCQKYFGNERWTFLPDYSDALNIVDAYLLAEESAKGI
jgi:hypothetical protein